MHLSKFLILCIVFSTASLLQVPDVSPGCRDTCHSQQERPYANCIKTCPDCHSVKMANRTDNMIEPYLDILGHERPCTLLCDRATLECMDNCPKTWCIHHGNPALFTTTTQPRTSTSQPPMEHGMTDTETSSMGTSSIIVTCVLLAVAILVLAMCLRKQCKKRHQQEEKQTADDKEETVPCTKVSFQAVKETNNAPGQALLVTTTV